MFKCKHRYVTVTLYTGQKVMVVTNMKQTCLLYHDLSVEIRYLRMHQNTSVVFS